MTTGSVEEASRLWLRRYRPIETPRARLVCFPHAGGGASGFRTWPQALPADVDVLAVRYPGRHDRLGDPCLDRMEQLADEVTAALTPLLGTPLVFFGHSMGAWVAYEIAVRLERAHGMTPELLVVSGQVAPLRRTPRRPLAADDDLILEIRRLGGYDDELFGDPEMRELLLPPIRADFALVGSYEPTTGVRLRCPVLACYGDRDADVRPAGVQAWAGTTTGGFEERVFPGGHFYLVDEQDALLRELSTRLTQRIARR